jgi:hypothetical protein
VDVIYRMTGALDLATGIRRLSLSMMAAWLPVTALVSLTGVDEAVFFVAGEVLWFAAALLGPWVVKGFGR